MPALSTDPFSRSYVTPRAGSAWAGTGTGGSGAGSLGFNAGGSRWGPQNNLGIVYDVVTRKYVNSTTGAPATGPIPGTNAYAVNGEWQATAPAAATSSAISQNRAEGKPDDFPRLYTTAQQPAVANYAATTLAALPAQSKATQGAVDKFISSFAAEAAATRASAPIVYDTSKTAAELRGADRTYQTESKSVLEQMEAKNREFEARQKAAQDARQNELRTYETATNAVGNQAIDYAQRGASARMVGLGPDVSRGHSGALSDRDAAILAGIRLPIQRELSGRRDALISEGMGLNREYLTNDRAVVQFKQALNEAFRGNTVATSQYLQNLLTQVRQLSQAEASALLAREADNLGLGQRLRSGEITLASMLAALEKSAIDYTYQQPFDPSRIAPTASYPISAPVSNYRPASGGGVFPGGVTVSPTPALPPMPPGYVSRGNPRWDAEFGYMPRQYLTDTPNFWNPNDGSGYVNGRYLGTESWRTSTDLPIL